MNTHTPADDEHREEAERLAQLPPAEQQAIIALHRSVAADRKVSKRNRDLAGERADARWNGIYGMVQIEVTIV